MSHLRLVDPGYRAPSVRVDQLDELERAAREAYRAGRQAVNELHEALERRDVYATIAAERRLLAAGLLARESATRLERSTWR